MNAEQLLGLTYGRSPEASAASQVVRLRRSSRLVARQVVTEDPRTDEVIEDHRSRKRWRFTRRSFDIKASVMGEGRSWVPSPKPVRQNPDKTLFDWARSRGSREATAVDRRGRVCARDPLEDDEVPEFTLRSGDRLILKVRCNRSVWSLRGDNRQHELSEGSPSGRQFALGCIYLRFSCTHWKIARLGSGSVLSALRTNCWSSRRTSGRRSVSLS